MVRSSLSAFLQIDPRLSAILIFIQKYIAPVEREQTNKKPAHSKIRTNNFLLHTATSIMT